MRIWWTGGSLLEEATEKCYKQQSTESQLLDLCYSGGCAWLKCAQVETKENTRCDRVVLGSPRSHGKWMVPDCGRLPRIQNFSIDQPSDPAVRTGKQVENNESKCQLSALCCRELQITAESRDHFPVIGQKKEPGCETLQGKNRWSPSGTFVVLKLCHMLEIKKPQAQARQQRVLMETRKGRLIDCCSERTH